MSGIDILIIMALMLGCLRVLFGRLLEDVVRQIHHVASGTEGAGGQEDAALDQSNQRKADRLISEAQVQMLTGQIDSAAALYKQSVELAVGAPLLLSEAHFGLFRVCKRRSDWEGAARQIELALSFSPKWREFKPSFEDLLVQEKERLRKGRT